MDFVKVNSTNIDKVGFEEDFRISMAIKPMTRMRVVFSHGGAYDYYRVPKEVYEDFLKADSAGVFFHKHIKKNYSNEKVT